MPAASARSNSPPDTTSAPRPQSAIRRSTARLGLAFTANATWTLRRLPQTVEHRAGVAFQRGARIDVDRRADLRRDPRQGHPFGVQLAVDQLEMVHVWGVLFRGKVEFVALALLRPAQQFVLAVGARFGRGGQQLLGGRRVGGAIRRDRQASPAAGFSGAALPQAARARTAAMTRTRFMLPPRAACARLQSLP